ncbi:MAG: hypothetical protein KJ072_15740 [Verrucomicrobia bacterium]|nr:hypothetical protein [Verrucomicrobiota bacterium]
MKPLSAFDNTLLRAKQLMALHDGLINVRKRGIRADWKKSFCKLMHWPQCCHIERVDSADAIIILREGAKLNASAFAKADMDDLLRSALVMAVSALDRYVHERICKGIVLAYRKSSLLKEQRDFSIPVSLALAATEALRKAHKAGLAVRPANEIRKKIQELLHTRPFQSWQEIDYGFKLLGISGLAGKMQASMNVASFDVVRNQLNAVVMRRHKIVHEGDLERHLRGGHPKKNAIGKKFVADSITFLEKLVDHLEGVH